MQKAIILFFVLMILSGIAMGQVPQLINYQALLIDPATGQSVPDDTYLIAFSLYNVASGGSIIWTEAHNVVTKNGLYSVLLGSVAPLTPEILSGPEKYLGIKVSGDPELTPRSRLVSVAYARIAESISGLSNVFPSDGNAGIGVTPPTVEIRWTRPMTRAGLAQDASSTLMPDHLKSAAQMGQYSGEPLVWVQYLFKVQEHG